jgi:hypothetical protein
MSKYYNPQRVRGLYEPGGKEAFRLSRSRIDLFFTIMGKMHILG